MDILEISEVKLQLPYSLFSENTLFNHGIETPQSGFPPSLTA